MHRTEILSKISPAQFEEVLWAYRDERAFHEKVTNQILDDLVAVCAPRMMEIHGEWFVRGGITTHVTCSYESEEWLLEI